MIVREVCFKKTSISILDFILLKIAGLPFLQTVWHSTWKNGHHQYVIKVTKLPKGFVRVYRVANVSALQSNHLFVQKSHSSPSFEPTAQLVWCLQSKSWVWKWWIEWVLFNVLEFKLASQSRLYQRKSFWTGTSQTISPYKRRFKLFWCQKKTEVLNNQIFLRCNQTQDKVSRLQLCLLDISNLRQVHLRPIIVSNLVVKSKCLYFDFERVSTLHLYQFQVYKRKSRSLRASQSQVHSLHQQSQDVLGLSVFQSSVIEGKSERSY